MLWSSFRPESIISQCSLTLADLRRRVVGEVLDQNVGVVGRGVLQELRAQCVRVVVARHVDEGERLDGALQATRSWSMAVRCSCSRSACACVCRDRPGRRLQARQHPFRVQDCRPLFVRRQLA